MPNVFEQRDKGFDRYLVWCGRRGQVQAKNVKEVDQRAAQAISLRLRLRRHAGGVDLSGQVEDDRQRVGGIEVGVHRRFEGFNARLVQLTLTFERLGAERTPQ